MEEKLGVIADNPNYNNGMASEDDLFSEELMKEVRFTKEQDPLLDQEFS